MRRRKVVYPPPKTATKGGSASSTDARPAVVNRVVSIDLGAMRGRADILPGTRVQISSGRYAGEMAIVESVAGGVIPAAVVRTESGQARRVRAVDLTPVSKDSGAPEA